ncbi:hypothetical protein [Granulicella arctica]|uniref:hypothetical protein n=1 Tax=Granulicella arctica TaxID=940613 RepID=UPI0021DF5B2F|nr:hypothetical protein [Granulicella arctica]
MNGRELEHVLSLIEQNVSANQVLLRSEIFRFIEKHQDEVVAQLRHSATARIPTSYGEMTLNLADLRKAVA